jgi:hypothetical protein
MDVTIKGIPDGIRIDNLVGEAAIKEWVAIAVDRFEHQKLNQIKAVSEAVKTTQINVDNFRKANSLTPKFNVEAPKVKETIVDVKPTTEK